MHRFKHAAALSLALDRFENRDRINKTQGGAALARRTEKLSRIVANDPDISDYELWRAERRAELEIFRLERLSQPIPIDLLYERSIVTRARAARQRHRL